jgi:ATP-dependent DNA helicase DinG
VVFISWLSEVYSYQHVKKKSVEEQLFNAIYKIYDHHDKYGLNDREGQQTMSLDIVDAYINSKNIMIEAGVGIGKSFGYLIPSLYINQFMNRPIVIATSSIQLSEQIHQDLHTITAKLGFSGVRSIVGKGMTHYACADRVAYLYSTSKNHPNHDIIKGIMEGEITERANIEGRVSNAEWSEFCVKKCKQERCHYKRGCSFYSMRSKIKSLRGEMNFIIVNQDLLIQDLLKKQAGNSRLITPNPALIIIDEAHNLEAKVRDARTIEFSLREIENDLDNALQLLIIGTGNRGFYSQFASVKKSLSQVFEQVDLIIKGLSSQDTDRIKIPKLKRIAFQKVMDELSDIHTSLSLLESSRREREQENALEAVSDLLDLYGILSGQLDSHLYWASKPKRETVISICPKEVNKLLRSMLFDGSTPVALTSATLCQGGEELKEKYAYLSKSIGYEGEFGDRQLSPFDYANQTIMYINNNIPYYKPDNKDSFLTAACQELIKLCNLTKGRTLVLFTAKEDLRVIYDKLKEQNLDWKLFVQSEGSSQDEIIKEFRQSNGVLLGTGVFWEGINIKGPDLSQVIIVRLPFPVPADPVYEYKVATAKDPQKDVYIPDMLIRLRQGTGRLIRSETDFGVLSILDSRMSLKANRDYRQDVLEALPFTNITEDFSEVAKFVKDNISSDVLDSKALQLNSATVADAG